MEDLIKYSSKEETRVEGPFHVGKKEVFDIEYSEMKLNPWQQDLLDFIRQNRNNKDLLDRKIIWIEDKVGNTGKSFFQKWLRVGQKYIVARKLPVSTVERPVTKVTEHIKVELFMINLTKTKGSDQSLDDLFATLEQIKDGYLVDVLYGKYVEAIFKPPIILVFTNESLANYRNKLTQDRWLGLHITNDKQIECYKYVGGGITPIKLRDCKLKKD